MKQRTNEWLTLRVKPRQEKRAEENLLKQDFSCYFPNIFSLNLKKNKILKESMFPGYAFLKIEQGRSLIPIKSTLGIISIVHFGDYYPILNSATLEGFKKVEDFSSRKPLVKIKERDEVVILSGPLKGLNGIVSKIREDRIEVLYTLLNQNHKTEVDSDIVNIV